jgi:hypothetical protein
MASVIKISGCAEVSMYDKRRPRAIRCHLLTAEDGYTYVNSYCASETQQFSEHCPIARFNSSLTTFRHSLGLQRNILVRFKTNHSAS